MKKTYPAALLFLTAFIWGMTIIAQRSGAAHIGSFTFNGVRFGIGALSLLPLIALYKNKTGGSGAGIKRSLWQGAAVGTLLFAASSTQQFGVALAGEVGKTGFINSLYIVIVPLIGIPAGKKVSKSIWIGVSLACFGFYILNAPHGFFPLETGDFMLLASAVLWAVHISAIGFFAGSVNPIRFAAVQYLTCSMLSLLCAVLFESINYTAILSAYIPILYAGVLSAGVANTLQIVGQRHMEASKAAIILSTSSLFTAAGAFFIMREVMGVWSYVGCALIFSGVVFSQIRK